MCKQVLYFIAAGLFATVVYAAIDEAAAEEARYFHIDLDITFGDGDRIDLEAVVEHGMDAQYDRSFESMERRIRFRIDDSFVNTRGVAVANVSLTLLEKRNDQWVERGAPRFGLGLGEQARLSMPAPASGDNSAYELELTVVPMSMEEVRELLGRDDISSSQCANDGINLPGWLGMVRSELVAGMGCIAPMARLEGAVRVAPVAARVRDSRL